MAQKKDIRDNVLKKRNFICQEELKSKSDTIFNKVVFSKEFEENSLILCYMNFGSEVQTTTFLEIARSKNKKVYLPKVSKVKKNMEFYVVENEKQLEAGYYGILEPKVELELPLYEGEKALMIMPGVAFDVNRNRIGYGGGFYDKFVDIHPDLYKMMVAFDMQEVPSFHGEGHDCKPDIIVTESRIIE